MRLLLDTNIALWAITDDARLRRCATDLIADPDNLVMVSAVNLWEIAIKHALRREQMPVSAADARRFFEESGYRLLSISPNHVIRVESLPPVHNDPFHRILVAQAIEEGCHLLTRDATLPRYSDIVVPV
ncbi:MAG: type II toxin-antitoxin system VapC family toxin [Spirochaetota bacterium]